MAPTARHALLSVALPDGDDAEELMMEAFVADNEASVTLGSHGEDGEIDVESAAMSAIDAALKDL